MKFESQRRTLPKSELRKRQVLSDWLGMKHVPEENPVSLPELVQKAFRKLGLAQRLEETTLTDGWKDIVGPMLESHCRPGIVKKGVLTIFVDHPAWMHQITMVHKANILRLLQERFPHLKIKDLFLKMG